MRGILKKVSYITVLLTMVLYVGLRIVPHHHCACDYVQKVHLGYGECGECSHEHHDGCDDNGHDCDAELCCGDTEFCRCADDDNIVCKKPAVNDFVAFIYTETGICCRETEPFKPIIRDDFTVPDAHCRSLSLRAPPVL